METAFFLETSQPIPSCLHTPTCMDFCRVIYKFYQAFDFALQITFIEFIMPHKPTQLLKSSIKLKTIGRWPMTTMANLKKQAN